MAEQVTLKDPYTEKRIYGSRTIFAALVVFVLLSLLTVRYFSLQITQHEAYRTQSDRNRVQLQPVPPKRGLIYDRNGMLLAENRASYSLTIVKERVDNVAETIGLLQQLIDIDNDHIKKYQRLVRRSKPYAAVPLKLKLTRKKSRLLPLTVIVCRAWMSMRG